ncbi:arginine--tRNA ligase [soil metagenome]
MLSDRLSELIQEALRKAADEGLVTLDGEYSIMLERPKRREHGDWSTNVALVIGRGQAQPRSIASALLERLPPSDIVDRVEVAGPGFLNFHLSPVWLHDVVRRAAAGAGFGRSDEGAGTRVNVEYVSANPTGPANVVSGRHAAVGDAIANLLEATGHEVTREYYFNDAGAQMRVFGETLAARYLEVFGAPSELPPEGYRGEYMVELAREIAQEIGDRLVVSDAEQRVASLTEMGLKRMLAKVRASLEKFGTRFDVWFFEASLHETGAVKAALDRLEQGGWLERREGAVWFASSRLGDDKDRVIVRANGATTYLAPDVAYMLDKFGRGFDRLIYVLGPDHHGTIARFLAIADALGFGRECVEIPIVQVVTIVRGGQAVRASKRAGVLVTLDELVDEVGSDAARYTFLTRSTDAPLEFDIELSKQQAPENPVYYVQYAHARISSILQRATASGIAVDVERASLERLEHPSEDVLMRKLASYEEVVPHAAQTRAPQKVAHYVEELASDFSAFYRDCRVITEDGPLTQARLALCVATKRVIADALGLLGVGAPEGM